MYYGKVEICGVNTSELRVLTDEEKTAYLRRAKGGDERAREELICGNLRLVLSVIQRFCGRKEPIDDIFQVGCIGLIKAIDNFNVELDVKFSTYAVPMIIGEVRRYLRDNNSIRVSRSMRDLAYRALTAREELIRDGANEPTAQAIADKLGENKLSVIRAMEAIVEPISLYEPVFNESGDSLYVIDQLSDTSESEEMWHECVALGEAIETLGPREKNIIIRRFYNNKTQTEVANEIGISQAQVSRLEKGAILKLRKCMQA